MGLTQKELEAILEQSRKATNRRLKEEKLINVQVYVASAMRLGATKAEIREAVARGILGFQEGE